MSENLYTKGYPHVPFPRGPHSVSAADLCTGGNDSVLIRLFYPTPAQQQKDSWSKDPLQWTSWYLGDQYSEGFVQFISSSPYSLYILPALKPFLYLYGYYLTKDIKVPASWCKGLLPRSGPSAEGVAVGVGGGGEGGDKERGGQEEKVGGWPVAILSHGMATHRSSISTLSSDLASHGFVVAAVEHREGSASASFQVDPQSREKEWVKYTAYRHNGQLDTRIEEIFNALSVLKRLNDGDHVDNLLQEDSPLPLESFKGALDMSSAVALGHSYGGVTVLKVLADPRNSFRCGVALDSWMFPVRAKSKELGESIKCPLLSVATEKFNQGPNQKALRALQEGHTNDKSSFFTMDGTCHHHGNDAPWVSGRFGWWVTGGTSSHHPQDIHKLQCSLILSFIHNHIDTDESSQEWISNCRKIIDESNHILISDGDDNCGGC